MSKFKKAVFDDGFELDDLSSKSRSELIESGTYVGTVIYTERSEIAVEVKDAVLKNQNTKKCRQTPAFFVDRFIL